MLNLILKFNESSSNPTQLIERIETSIVAKDLNETTDIYVTKRFLENFIKTSKETTTKRASKQIVTLHTNKENKTTYKTSFKYNSEEEYLRLESIQVVKPEKKVIYKKDYSKEATQAVYALKNTEWKLPMPEEKNKKNKR